MINRSKATVLTVLTALTATAVLTVFAVPAACASAPGPVETPGPASSEASPVAAAAPVTLPLRFDGRDGAITLLTIGRITVKECHARLCVPEATPALLRFAGIFASSTFGPSLPIGVGVIDHPDARLLVDTGELARFNDDDGYYACDATGGDVDHNLLRMSVRRDDEVFAQLGRLSPARAVETVVLTHLHADHTGGVPAFPAARIVTSRGDVALGTRGGAVVCRSLSGARIAAAEDLLAAPHASGARGAHDDVRDDVRDEVDRHFGASARLTADGRVRLLSLPGHTPGSLGVLVRSDDVDVLFVGDIAYDQAQLARGHLLGIHADFDAVRASMALVRGWAARHPTVIVPSHDDDAGRRLAARATWTPDPPDLEAR